MFLKEKTTGHLVEVLEQIELHDPFMTLVTGRYHYGEEMQDPDKFEKSNLVFQSNEALPACWVNPHYRDHELRRTA